jgi:hypothetical protein
MVVRLVFVVAVAFGGLYVYSHGLPTTRRAQDRVQVQVRNDIDDTRLTVAAVNVETWHKVNETYTDAPTGLNNVALARATDDTYCVQDTRFHLAGPGGAIQPGPCP